MEYAVLSLSTVYASLIAFSCTICHYCLWARYQANKAGGVNFGNTPEETSVESNRLKRAILFFDRVSHSVDLPHLLFVILSNSISSLGESASFYITLSTVVVSFCLVFKAANAERCVCCNSLPGNPLSTIFDDLKKIRGVCKTTLPSSAEEPLLVPTA